MTAKQAIFLCAILGASLIAISCSSGPRPPQPGTPPFFWAAAKQTFNAGDYTKALDNLASLTKSDNDFTARALPWQLVLSAGMFQGYQDLAETYEGGAKAKRDNPTPFRKQVTLCRTAAGQLAMQFAEAYHKFQQTNKEGPVTLAFPYPAGNTMPAPALKRISSGIIVPEAEADTMQKQALQRGVLLAVCRALGVGEDVAKAQEMFKAENVQAPRDSFQLAMANALYEQSQLFTRDKLDRPDRMDILNKEAMEVAKGLPANKETKALLNKIQKSTKKR